LASTLSFFDVSQAFIFCTSLLILSIAAVSGRFLLLSARRTHWYFLGIFILWAAANLLPLFESSSSKSYFWFYIGTTPVLWALYLAAAFFLYRSVFADYPGIASMGKWAVLAAAVAIIAAGSASLVFSRGLFSPGQLYTLVTTIDRSLLVGLSLFLVILVSIMSCYPIAIGRNLAVHCVLFSAILLVQALQSVGDQWTSHRFTDITNAVSSLFSAVLFLLWTRILNPEGDLTIVRVRQRIDPDVEYRLLGQLNSINGILLRAGRK
jgi:hypothetical protein